jgi:hypothetical protein
MYIIHVDKLKLHGGIRMWKDCECLAFFNVYGIHFLSNFPQNS